MYRSVLDNKDFITWSHEGLVALVAHNELGHEELKETDAYGKEQRRCTLYPGLACRDHLNAAVDIDTARDEELIKVPFIELCPNSWLVAPTGEASQITEEEQFVPAKIRERVEALQKTLGPAVASKAYAAMQDLAAKADLAIDDNRFADALAHLAALGKSVKAPHAALKTYLEARRTSIDEDVVFEFEDARDDAKLSVADKRAKIEKLLAAVDIEVLGTRLPCHAAMKAWLAQ